MSLEAGPAPSAGGLGEPSSRSASRNVATSHISDSEFPMYVVPVATLLRMTRMETHEHLQDTCELVQFAPRMCESVMFVSHTWLSADHPDPDGVQLGVLQTFCRHLQRPDRPLRASWQQELLRGAVQLAAADLAKVKYVWLDYCCSPQAAGEASRESRCRAIKSLTKYVLNSRFFVVVAPAGMHREQRELYDYRTWAARGWCRAELLAHVAAKSCEVIVAESESNFYLDAASWRDVLLRPPGCGSFSVASDKALLGPMLARLLDARIAREAERGDLQLWRFLRATRVQLLQGMGLARPEIGFKRWMEQLGFASATDDGAGGWTPLRYAVYGQRYDVAQQLLEGRADVEAPLLEESASYGHGHHLKSCTILAGLACIRDDPEGIAWLVRARANPCRTLARKCFPLFLAAGVGHLGTVKALLELKANPRQRNEVGDDCTSAAIFGGQAKVAKLLIEEHGCPADGRSALGWRSGFCAVVAAGDTLTLRLVLELRADLNFQNVPSGFPTIMTAAVQAAYYFQHRDPTKVVELFSHVPGMTPLAGACFFGNLAQARLLLQARADASVANCYSRTPLSFAAARGQVVMLQEVLQAAPQCLNTPDCWGCCPLDHALAARNGMAAVWLAQQGAVRGQVPQHRACCSEPSGFVRMQAKPERVEAQPSISERRRSQNI